MQTSFVIHTFGATLIPWKYHKQNQPILEATPNPKFIFILFLFTYFAQPILFFSLSPVDLFFLNILVSKNTSEQVFFGIHIYLLEETNLSKILAATQKVCWKFVANFQWGANCVCMDKLCVCTSCVCVSKLCVSKLCVSKLCVSKLCVSKLCVNKLCVCEQVVCGQVVCEQIVCE